jgi:hypothetical protein
LALPSTTTIHQSKNIVPIIQEETPIVSGGHKKKMVHVFIQKADQYQFKTMKTSLILVVIIKQPQQHILGFITSFLKNYCFF